MHRFAAALLCLAACDRSTPSESELVRDAQDETRRFFALAEGGDCTQLRALMQLPSLCESMVADFKDTHSHLAQILDAKLDGRDKHTVLVHVDVQSTKREHQWIVRAKWTSSGWKVAL